MKYLTYTVISTLFFISACSQKNEQPSPVPIAKVSVADVTRGNLPEIITGFGTIAFNPANQHTLNAEIDSQVLEILSIPGEMVSKGDTVLKLVPSDVAKTDLVRARRDANAAKISVERIKRLRRDGLASDADLESSTTNANDLATVADSLEKRASEIQSLQSPIDGVVDSVAVELGDLVASGSMMVRIASLNAIQARIGIEIEDATRLSNGDSALLIAQDNTQKTVEATIKVIDARIDIQTRMASALIEIPDGNGFLPGQAVLAKIIIDTKKDVIIVPRKSVFTDETGDFVFLAENNVALLRRVETGLTSGDFTEIRNGLSANEQVVLEGASILSDGMKIKKTDQPKPTNQESQQ